METEDSEEVTSAEHAASPECPICENEINKKNLELESPLCQDCQLKLNELNETCKTRTNEMKKKNCELNLECMKSMKRNFELSKSFESNYKNFQLVESFDRKIRNLNRDFSDSFNILFKIYQEKSELSRRLNEKQCALEGINERIRGVNGNAWGNVEELRNENTLLIEKVKDSEIDRFLEIKELNEAIFCIKNQVLRENKMGIRTLSGEIKSFKLLSEIKDSLEQDLKETVLKINLLLGL